MGKTAIGKTQIKTMQDMAGLLKAASHPDRLIMLYLLSKNGEKSLTVKSIYQKLKLKQPVVSRHLNILRSAGVVQRKQQGKEVYYSLSTDNKYIGLLMKCF